MILLSIDLLINFGKKKVEYKRLYHPNYHAGHDPGACEKIGDRPDLDEF